jgi:serine beta-lactamase-like protein LACTB
MIFFNLKHFSLLKFLVWIIVPLFFSCNGSNVDSERVFYKQQYKEAVNESTKALGEYFFTSFIPGLSVSVSVDGEIVWSQGVGEASKELKVPAPRNTKYRIGTTSGLFTSYIIALLQQEGAINIDSSYYHYVPGFPEKEYDFNLRMLGAHTAGFRQQTLDDLFRIDSIRTFKNYVHYFKNEKLLFKPNDYYEPSVYNTGLLAILAETVSGKSYEKLVHDMLKDTLGLLSLSFDHPSIIVENRSDFYDLDYIARLCNASEVNLRPYAPVAGVLLTADDLNRAACAMIEPGLFTAETLEMLSNQHITNSGNEINHSFGWLVLSDDQGRKLLAKIGEIKGGSSVVVVYPEQKLVITVAANKEVGNAELPANRIAQIFLKYMDAE